MKIEKKEFKTRKHGPKPLWWTVLFLIHPCIPMPLHFSPIVPQRARGYFYTARLWMEPHDLLWSTKWGRVMVSQVLRASASLSVCLPLGRNARDSLPVRRSDTGWGTAQMSSLAGPHPGRPIPISLQVCEFGNDSLLHATEMSSWFLPSLY